MRVFISTSVIYHPLRDEFRRYSHKDKTEFPHKHDRLYHAECTEETLREKCPNTELFLVRIFLYSDWIRTKNNSVFEHFSRSESYIDDYVGKKVRCISERVIDHSGRYKNSNILKHQIEKYFVHNTSVVVIRSGFRNYTKKKKLSEALWINTTRPSLNKQEKSIPLRLFN